MGAWRRVERGERVVGQLGGKRKIAACTDAFSASSRDRQVLALTSPGVGRVGWGPVQASGTVWVARYNWGPFLRGVVISVFRAW